MTPVNVTPRQLRATADFHDRLARLSGRDTERHTDAARRLRDRAETLPEDDYCQECGADIRTGYSWEGLCAACAEKHHEPARFPAIAKLIDSEVTP